MIDLRNLIYIELYKLFSSTRTYVTFFIAIALMLIINLGIAGVIWFGGVRVIREDLQVGQIMTFVNYLLTVDAICKGPGKIGILPDGVIVSLG